MRYELKAYSRFLVWFRNWCESFHEDVWWTNFEHGSCSVPSLRSGITEKLTRRPVHLSSTQQMQMQMENCLARVRPHVVYGAKSVLQLALLGDFCGDQMGIADNLCIRLGQVIDTGNVFLGDNKDVRRRAGFDVFKREDLLIFVNFFRRYGSGNDLAEEAVSHGKNVIRACPAMVKHLAISH